MQPDFMNTGAFSSIHKLKFDVYHEARQGPVEVLGQCNRYLFIILRSDCTNTLSD